MLGTCIFWDKTWDCLASKWKDSGGNLSDVCKCLMGGRKEDGARLFSWISCERTKGNGHKRKYRKFHLKLRIFFTVRVVKWWHRLPRVDVESLSLEIPKPHRPWTWTTFSSWSCCEQRAWTTGTFQPPPFYGSATLGRETSYSCPLSSNSCVFQGSFPVSNEKLVQQIPILHIINQSF